MATIVYQQQSSQPCLDSHSLLQPRTILSLKLSSPQLKCQNNNNNNDDDDQAISKGGWSFLQSLASAAPTHEAAPYYVHPLSRRGAGPGTVHLSERSLALCTEDLGNETGTTDAECAAGSGGGAAARREGGRERRRSSAARSFPPPLTTMSALQMRSRREDGRLVVEAVSAPRVSSCFVAERSEGRLRLRLVEGFEPMGIGSAGADDVEREGLENDAVEEEIKEEEVGVGELEMEESKGVGESEREKGEVGRIEKFGRVRGGRCKEGGDQYIVENKTMLKPFWVAT